MKEEIWRPVRGYEGLYEVSSFARVRSLERPVSTMHKFVAIKKGKILSQKLTGKKHALYFRVTLSKNNIAKSFAAHRLVAESFVENLHDKPVVNHIDGIKTNNRPENLEWVTSKENTHHASGLGLMCKGERINTAKLNLSQVKEIRQLLKQGKSQRSLARKFGVSSTSITSIALGRSWKHVKEDGV